ncbi:MAG: N-acetylneuraminate synthase family protein [Candidatus Accumulibacter sp.]|uniref:N-acetylneuraminate synthase family protein n=1 Tax=Accumulibacter sp. TaxID=2053492 RepID=UPI001A067D84|nr:N-acetylneuraminate synthase family protein [Accumulibacter sp.]MBE2260237.1 N-acetylneuraminate synthase family protein [Paracoccaceae bacterium]MCP5248795.1 N-acetylneuraminate synthase family protein [Accumulibacter sp.]
MTASPNTSAPEIFEHLFVLELANNHQGRLERGLRIVRDFSRIVRFNNVKAAIKLQLRDVDAFIHRDFRARTDIRYIKRTLDTRLAKDEYASLTTAIRRGGCIPMATPFDEVSVDLCVELGVDIIKIASSDINDWILIEKIATTRKPVVVSTGGSSLKDVDDLVKFFNRRGIPLAINHCVSLYPSEDHEIELNQIDFLRRRYPLNVIGLSTHEHGDWQTSIAIAYAKGARTFERHIDIAADDIPVAAYCSLPQQIDQWFKAYRRVVEMCGAPGTQKRIPLNRESQYLDALVRGVYARRDLRRGHALCDDDIYLAIPLQKGQISCRELMRGELLLHDVAADGPIMIDMIDSPYAEIEQLKALIYQRGL